MTDHAKPTNAERARATLTRANAENAVADTLEGRLESATTATARSNLRNAARRHRTEALRLLEDARTLANTPDTPPHF